MADSTDRTATNSSDEQAYVQYGETLQAAVRDALGSWLVAQVESRLGQPIPSDLNAAIDSIVADADSRLDELVHADVDEPLSGPLARIRSAVMAINPLLDAAGVPHPHRDPFDAAREPDDIYQLGPVAFVDLGEEVHGAGIAWGAAKAYLHRARRQ